VGGWVASGTKTKAPVSLEEAKETYEKLLKEKRKKGYVQGDDAPAFSQTEGAVDSGVRPMLLTPDDEENIEKYILDPAWGSQQKLNGKRILTRVKAGKVEGINKTGLICPIPKAVEQALSILKGAHTFDGELIGDVYHVFDLLESTSFKDSIPCEARHAGVRFVLFDVKSPHIQITPFAIGEAAKREMVKSLRDGRKEGVVFKRLDTAYTPGKFDNLKKAVAVKVKFYTEGSFFVLDWNKGTSSVQVAALDGKKHVSVGNVTVAAKYADQVSKGNVVRVRYLYATPSGKLYQPNLDATDDGVVVADGPADKFGSLKYEGKDE
jgi:bifunctional non-homologous end joining protein LigD